MFFFEKCLKVNKSCLPDLKGDANMSEKLGTELGIVYECVKCGAKVSLEELDLRGGGVKCTYCGYRVLRKVRPPVVKRIKTR
jgi:DNA-directed RNA polymerase subunit RPC12/RpoP